LFQIVLIFFLPFGLFAQYASTDLLYPSAESAALGSEGVGLTDKTISLAANPAFLANSKSMVAIGNVYLPASGQAYGAVRPAATGLYYPITDKFGMGLRVRTIYGSEFYYEQRNSSIQSHLFGSYAITEKLSMFAGVGPSLTYRNGEQSSWSYSFNAGLGYVSGKWSIGLTAQRPGVFNYKRYRGSDVLEEKLPDSFSLGAGFKALENLTFYSEVRRVLWEKSWFSLNDLPAKPNTERGIGAELKLSGGAIYTIKNEASVWKIRAGLEMGGKYSDAGQNQRSTGLGVGLTYRPGWNDETGNFTYTFSLLDYSVLAKRGGRYPETILYFGIGFSIPEADEMTIRHRPKTAYEPKNF
jgi:hypothetical protein